MSNFEAYSKYYDLLYKNKDYKSESDYVINCLTEMNPEIQSILELGCGSGSHANYICEQGFRITGIERSQSMLHKAVQKNISNFNPVQGDISSFDLNQKFDVAFSLFHVISYLTDNQSLLGCFQSVYKHLNTGGLFLFDFWYSPAVYNLKPETRVKRLEDETLSITRIAESDLNHNENVVAVNIEVLIKDKISNKTEIINEKHLMRHFSLPELLLIADFTGFEIIKTEEFLTHEIPSENTWGVCIILKKK